MKIMYVRVITCLSLLLAYAEALPRPKYMQACSIKDPDINKCARKAAQEVINNISHGDRKYGIPDLKPLKLPIVEVDGGGSFTLSFRDLEVHGVNEVVIKNIEIKDKEMKINYYIETLQFVGPYEAKGKILILPIEGKGAANITAVKVDLNYTCNWELYEENKVTCAKIITPNIDFDLKGASFKLENLFNGDQKLGDHVNTFMNENWEEVIKDLKPSVNKIMSDVVTSIIASYFKKIPQNEIFLE